MHTAVIFVDAGYLFSAGADAVAGRLVARRDIALRNPQGLIERTMERVSGLWDGDTLRLLRTYWYDGARDGVPSASQVQIGDLPRVKLRLGRVSGGGQKGVDGLIILDLITLARNRAADVAIIVSGDEDLRETASHVQSFGVTVVVAGFPKTSLQGQSVLLLREADHVVTLTADDVRQHFDIKERAGVDLPNASATLPEDADALVGGPEAPAAEPVPSVDEAPSEEDAEESLRELCRGVVNDPRFAGGSALEPWSDGLRLTQRADRVLVARLAELTGVFPVDPQVLRRARAICRDLAKTGADRNAVGV